VRPRIENVDFAVDEHIWGHRLYDEQLPHLAVLEFLTVLHSNTAAPLRSTENAPPRYRPQRQIRLRALLFNNPFVESVRARPLSDQQKWSAWSERFEKDAEGLDQADFTYLYEVFADFEHFAKAIELLRSSSFEARSNKRWSSKFVFPFGPDALYEDLRIDTKGAASNDRRFFARTGELLYLMLARAKRGPELGDRLVERLFDASLPMNRLVRALQGPPQSAMDDRPVGYLPDTCSPRFDRLCDDWLAILSRDIPVYDALEHLIALTGLNLLLYFLERGKTQNGDPEPIEIVCEIVTRDRTKIRALSAESYLTNQGYSSAAVRSSIEQVKLSPEWAAALASSDPKSDCADVLRTMFQWPPEDGGNDADADALNKDGDQLIEQLVEKALSRHEQHIDKIHATWARAIGLSSRRLSRRTRYAPNDRLLKSLVVAIVDDRMQFDEFLAEAQSRYGLIIGDIEGAGLIKDKLVDQEALSDNRANLEARLAGLGLVRRLSDSCSFVENPFARGGVR
jgi:hypothetical protein